jgi:4-hydroxybenzoate polyprenyltransferase
MSFAAGLLKSMRPAQWVKNGFVLAAPLFSLRLFQGPDFVRSIEAMGLFCLLSGSIYIWNDIVDRHRDRAHPEKRSRPIASGELNVIGAGIAAAILGGASVVAGFLLHSLFGWICLAYLANNLLYSHLLKRMVILDVISIAIGFVLRAMAGGEAIQVSISTWLVLCTFLVALFLGFSKRRHEMVLLQSTASQHRKSLEQYSLPFLDMMIAIVTASTILSYSLYTVSAETVMKFGTDNLIFTTLFVIYGIFRYLYLVYCREEGGNPTRILFNDRPLQVTILAWLASSLWIISR